MTPKEQALEDAIAAMRYRVVNGLVSDEERRENAISFAYGNGHIDCPEITREGVARAYDALIAERKEHINGS